MQNESFKVGDTVKIIAKGDDLEGQIRTVIWADDINCVHLDDEGSFFGLWYGNHEIELQKE